MIFNGALGAFGSLYLKKGANKLELKLSKLYKNIHNTNLIFGVLIYGIAASISIVLLMYNDLSLIYPLTSITYIFTIFLSVKFLNEKMNKYKWLAIILIIAGNVLITI
jgi:drug/metabolite transporter (DMT)-like permease